MNYVLQLNKYNSLQKNTTGIKPVDSEQKYLEYLKSLLF